jgi:hypothetical protein
MYKIIGADQKEYGPVSADQLRQWLTEGRVNGQTKVQAADATEWKTMAELPEFAVLLPKSPPPPPTRAAPITLPPPSSSTSQMAVWAMVTGLFSLLCCCGIASPVAIVLGAVALSRFKSHSELTGRGYAIAGIVLGIVAILVHIAAAASFLLNPSLMQNLQNALPQ